MAARLSERLETVIRMVTPGHAVLDVGCDHGFTAIRLVEDGISPCAVASDVREGPLAAARQHVAEAGLSKQIAVTLADGVPAGFAGITGTRPVTVILAGMGGLLMTDILKAAFRRGNSFSELVLSPQRDAEALRGCLDENGYRIEAERFIREDGKFYQIIRAAKRENGGSERPLAPEELRYGPLLLSEGDPGMTTYISSQITRMTDLLSRIDGRAASERAKARRRELEEELALLRRALARIRNGARGREVTSDDGDD